MYKQASKKKWVTKENKRKKEHAKWGANIKCTNNKVQPLERKINFIWTPRRNLSAKDSPWSTEGPDFIHKKSPAATCWQGLLMYSVWQEEPPTELWASPSKPCFFTPPKSATAGRLWFWLLKKGLRPAPVHSELHNYILICIYNDQSQLLYNNQSECKIPTNQNCMVWSNQKCTNLETSSA